MDEKMKNKLDKMWEMAISHEEHQNANKRRNSWSVKTSEVTVNPDASPTISSCETRILSVTPTTDISSNLLYTATFTGTISTIVLSNPSSELDTTSFTYNINNTNDNNNKKNKNKNKNNDLKNNNDFGQAIVYEQLNSNSSGETLISTKDYEFVDLIHEPNYSVIYLFDLFSSTTSANFV